MEEHWWCMQHTPFLNSTLTSCGVESRYTELCRCTRYSIAYKSNGFSSSYSYSKVSSERKGSRYAVDPRSLYVLKELLAHLSRDEAVQGLKPVQGVIERIEEFKIVHGPLSPRLFEAELEPQYGGTEMAQMWVKLGCVGKHTLPDDVVHQEVLDGAMEVADLSLREERWSCVGVGESSGVIWVRAVAGIRVVDERNSEAEASGELVSSCMGCGAVAYGSVFGWDSQVQVELLVTLLNHCAGGPSLQAGPKSWGNGDGRDARKDRVNLLSAMALRIQTGR
ncbi:hypothetical protein BDZ97DRAFT_2060094 [Flammula alnicola]|nr:hypothetical protein BDZ97DRAFT_2060094 [Flammula alnicola]